MDDRNVQITKVIDGLTAAQATAIELNNETLLYLIGLALDEAKREAGTTRPDPDRKKE